MLTTVLCKLSKEIFMNKSKLNMAIIVFSFFIILCSLAHLQAQEKDAKVIKSDKDEFLFIPGAQSIGKIKNDIDNDRKKITEYKETISHAYQDWKALADTMKGVHDDMKKILVADNSDTPPKTKKADLLKSIENLEKPIVTLTPQNEKKPNDDDTAHWIRYGKQQVPLYNKKIKKVIDKNWERKINQAGFDEIKKDLSNGADESLSEYLKKEWGTIENALNFTKTTGGDK